MKTHKIEGFISPLNEFFRKLIREQYPDFDLENKTMRIRFAESCGINESTLRRDILYSRHKNKIGITRHLVECLKKKLVFDDKDLIIVGVKIINMKHTRTHGKSKKVNKESSTFKEPFKELPVEELPITTPSVITTSQDVDTEILFPSFPKPLPQSKPTLSQSLSPKAIFFRKLIMEQYPELDINGTEKYFTEFANECGINPNMFYREFINSLIPNRSNTNAIMGKTIKGLQKKLTFSIKELIENGLKVWGKIENDSEEELPKELPKEEPEEEPEEELPNVNSKEEKQFESLLQPIQFKGRNCWIFEVLVSMLGREKLMDPERYMSEKTNNHGHFLKKVDYEYVDLLEMNPTIQKFRDLIRIKTGYNKFQCHVLYEPGIHIFLYLISDSTTKQMRRFINKTSSNSHVKKEENEYKEELEKFEKVKESFRSFTKILTEYSKE